MLTNYIQAAMRQTQYEILPDNEGYFGRIPELQGVWANANTLEACREELQEVLEEWITIGLTMGNPIPTIDGIENVSRRGYHSGANA
jgi:predicted RNase H-like HicB family nuclease